MLCSARCSRVPVVGSSGSASISTAKLLTELQVNIRVMVVRVSSSQRRRCGARRRSISGSAHSQPPRA